MATIPGDRRWYPVTSDCGYVGGRIPCIATNVGSNKEIVSHGETELLVPSGSPEQLAEDIFWLIQRNDARCVTMRGTVFTSISILKIR